MFWIEILPATIFLLALLMIPESPRYLVLIGKRDLAIDVLTTLNGRDAAVTKVGEIEASLARDHHRPKLSDLLDQPIWKDPAHRLGRAWARNAAATRRHQRGVLLRSGALAVGRVHGE